MKSSREIDSMRVNDYEFYYKIFRTAKAELTIPSGYKLSHLAEKIIIKRADYSFELQYKLVGNKIIYTKKNDNYNFDMDIF